MKMNTSLIIVDDSKKMQMSMSLSKLRTGQRSERSERGVALVVSLILLVAMTVLGVATLSGTRLNEKITSNAQQKAMAFEVAESAIAAVWHKDYVNKVLISDLADNGDDPAAIVSPDIDTGIQSGYNQSYATGGVGFDGELSIQYCGEMANVGSDRNADESGSQFVYRLFDVNSVVSIDSSSSQADHVQRGASTALKTQRTGACPAR